MPVTQKSISGVAFLGFEEKVHFLEEELLDRFKIEKSEIIQYGDILYLPNLTEKIKPFWASTVFLSPFKIEFNSISEAAQALKNIQRNWASYQFNCFRRASLIQEKLPYINTKPKAFPFSVPKSNVGIWTLLDEHTILASNETTSFFPAGKFQLIEDHENPPSRAYLKIQEAIVQFESFFGEIPQKNQRCFDAGACPGGWTWALVQLGCSVFAVDRSPLVPDLMANPQVTFLTHDAFTLKPADIGDFDWVFSDVICYPKRLLEWIKMWLKQEKVPNMICTIKMQGETNWALIEEFEAIAGSKVVHLNYNKHELTWLYKVDKNL